MSNFQLFKELMEKYTEDKGYSLSLGTSITEASYSQESKHSLCNCDLEVINMDRFAQKGYRKIILPDSQSEDDSINTADAFIVDADNEWYFIEFKDGKLSNKSNKASVLKKAYSNAYAVLDVLYSMKETKFAYKGFDYENPIDFLRKQVNYILVFSEKQNADHTMQMLNHKHKNEKYLPEFMARLKGYIYKDAYAMTESTFEHTFPNSVCY